MNNLIDNLDIMNVYRTLYPAIRVYTFFSSTHGTYMKIDHVLCPKANSNRIQRNPYPQNMFSNHIEIKLVNNKKKKFLILMHLDIKSTH